MAATPKAPQPPPPLWVVLADDHHHVLPEIHYAIRRRRLPFRGVHLVHWDAHPDLSFPRGLDPGLVFEPEALYEALEASPAGIAEFLVPLLDAGHVQRLTWVQSPWSRQMRPGRMSDIAIGRRPRMPRSSASATTADAASPTASSSSPSPGPQELELVVSCPWPHFVQEELFAPEETMLPGSIKRWDLVVTRAELDDDGSGGGRCVPYEPLEDEDPSAAWVLDVDLDYFTTWNPFRQDLAAHGLMDETTLALLTTVFTGPRFNDPLVVMSPDQRLKEQTQFHAALAELRRAFELGAPSSTVDRIVETLVTLYDAQDGPEAGALGAFVDLLRRLHGTNSGRDLLGLIWHAAPSLDLPHHESPGDELDALLSHFASFLRRHRARPPALVTIATSVSDRFLPPPQLETVRDRVLASLEGVWGPLDVQHIEYEPAPPSPSTTSPMAT